jgi:hypothetical protein
LLRDARDRANKKAEQSLQASFFPERGHVNFSFGLCNRLAEHYSKTVERFVTEVSKDGHKISMAAACAPGGFPHFTVMAGRVLELWKLLMARILHGHWKYDRSLALHCLANLRLPGTRLENPMNPPGRHPRFGTV